MIVKSRQLHAHEKHKLLLNFSNIQCTKELAYFDFAATDNIFIVNILNI